MHLWRGIKNAQAKGRNTQGRGLSALAFWCSISHMTSATRTANAALAAAAVAILVMVFGIATPSMPTTINHTTATTRGH